MSKPRRAWAVLMPDGRFWPWWAIAPALFDYRHEALDCIADQILDDATRKDCRAVRVLVSVERKP